MLVPLSDLGQSEISSIPPYQPYLPTPVDKIVNNFLMRLGLVEIE